MTYSSVTPFLAYTLGLKPYFLNGLVTGDDCPIDFFDIVDCIYTDSIKFIVIYLIQ